jgi:type IV pilus assembly protein PilW
MQPLNRINLMRNGKLRSKFELGRQTSGFSLIELLVSMAIGLVVALAITTVLIGTNSNQRTTTALNDAVQTGAFASLSFDRLARSAGSGFIQASSAFGCLINAGIAPGPQQILPPQAALPVPFAGIGTTTAGGVPVRLAPVVIVDGGADPVTGQASDQLIVMTGTHGFSEARLPMKVNSTTDLNTRLESTLGLNANDLVLVADGTPGGPCMVQQVLSTAGNVVNFGNKYYDTVGVPASTVLNGFRTSITASVIPLGSVSALPTDPDPNPPQFHVYGVSTANELVRYNLLADPDSAVIEPLSENVVSIQAIYGRGTVTAGLPPSLEEAYVPETPAPLVWQPPTGTYTANNTAGNLLDGSLASRARLQGIKTVRIAMVVRSPLQERPPIPPALPVAPASLVMFGDTANPVTYTVPTDQRNFRHRIIETVIPLRNL